MQLEASVRMATFMLALVAEKSSSGVQPGNGRWTALDVRPDRIWGGVSGKAQRGGLVALFQRVVIPPGFSLGRALAGRSSFDPSGGRVYSTKCLSTHQLHAVRSDQPRF